MYLPSNYEPDEEVRVTRIDSDAGRDPSKDLQEALKESEKRRVDSEAKMARIADLESQVEKLEFRESMKAVGTKQMVEIREESDDVVDEVQRDLR